VCVDNGCLTSSVYPRKLNKKQYHNVFNFLSTVGVIDIQLIRTTTTKLVSSTPNSFNCQKKHTCTCTKCFHYESTYFFEKIHCSSQYSVQDGNKNSRNREKVIHCTVVAHSTVYRMGTGCSRNGGKFQFCRKVVRTPSVHYTPR
jgi:hypothetical protein